MHTLVDSMNCYRVCKRKSDIYKITYEGTENYIPLYLKMVCVEPFI